MATRNKVLSSRDLLKDLGLKRDDKRWRGIRVILMQRYGMTKIPGVGTCILQSNYEKFLCDMNASDFITSGLREFINIFPQTKVSYEFDIYASTHYVEVIPSDVYHLDASYIEWENSFFNAFISQFPDQNICFISDDAPINLEEVSFELTGKEYISGISFINALDYFVRDVNVNFNNKMKVFRVLFGILFITALIAALLGYTHQIAIAAICAVVLLTTNPKQNEPI